jgi:hypothetical protein
MIKPALLLSVLLLSLASAAEADNFRCPNGEIVSTGDNQSVVAMKCDPPTYKSARTESIAGYKGATILVSVEEWTYNEGPNRLVHILTFRNGQLDSVQTAGFGK